MLCTLNAAPFDDPASIFEPKYDGLRGLAHFDGRELTLLSRNGASQNFQFPDVVTALRGSPTRPGIVDGEVVYLDEYGRSSFRALQQRFHLTKTRQVAIRTQQHPAYLYLFDLLYVDAYDVRRLPLKDRKVLLREAVHWSHQVRPVPQTVTQGIDAGRLEFVLHGQKLRGRFALIRMRGTGRGTEPWRLTTRQDALAHAEGRVDGNVRGPRSPQSDTSPAHPSAGARARANPRPQGH